MLIIIDKKIPAEAKKKLQTFGYLLELETKGISYPAISGHPDIFFAQVDDQLIVAPNLPGKFVEELRNNNIRFIFGDRQVGEKYPETAGYNAVSSKKHLIHNSNLTDPQIRNLCKNKNKTPIQINQGYTRCNLVFLDDEHAITSDEGILRTLRSVGIETLFVPPDGIELPGFPHGFFGGCCGFYNNRLFIIGNLEYFSAGEMVRQFSSKLDVEIVELCDTPLYDGGGVMFVEV